MTTSSRFSLKKVKRGFLITISVVIGLALAGFGIYSTMSFSEGARIGNVIKISKKGVVFKTWEGQLNLGAMTSQNGDGIPNTIWEFSVPKSNTQVLDDINKAIEQNKRVRLHYDEKYIQLEWRGDTRYLITKVDILDN